MTSDHSPPAPSADPERLVALDFIRGIAVLGILAANIVAFGQPFLAYYWPGGFATPPQPSDPWLWGAQLVLIDGKMRGLFSLLFGAGLALFADRAEARGAGEELQLRRLGLLLLFGIAHYYLLWRGDILTLYAVCGFLVFPALGLSVVRQFALGLTVWVGSALYGLIDLLLAWRNAGGRADVAEARSDGAREIALAESGSYADYVRHAAGEHTWNWIDQLFFSAPETIGLMLVGMSMLRGGAFAGEANIPLRWAWTALALGSVAAAAIAVLAAMEGATYWGTLLALEGAGALARIPVVLGLAVILAHLGRTVRGRLGAALIASGRMAFTNYIGTSVLMLFVFQAPGLRLMGELTRAELYLVVAGAWIAMLAWSTLWMARFRFGPLEWVWRCLTYGRAFYLPR